MDRYYSEPQLKFIWCKAVFEELDEQLKDRREQRDDIPEIDSDLTREDIEKECQIDSKIKQELGWYEAMENLHDARDEMVAWAIDSIIDEVDTDKFSEYSDDELRGLKDRYKKLPQLKERMVDICMSYNPKKEAVA